MASKSIETRIEESKSKISTYEQKRDEYINKINAEKKVLDELYAKRDMKKFSEVKQTVNSEDLDLLLEAIKSKDIGTIKEILETKDTKIEQNN